MEHSTRRRIARIYNVEEAQIMFDEIPSDGGETTDEEESDTDNTDPTFLPPLFEDLPDREENNVNKEKEDDNEGEETDEDMNEGNENQKSAPTEKQKKKTELNRKWKKKNEPMVINEFTIQEGV